MKPSSTTVRRFGAGGPTWRYDLCNSRHTTLVPITAVDLELRFGLSVVSQALASTATNPTSRTEITTPRANDSVKSVE